MNTKIRGIARMPAGSVDLSSFAQNHNQMRRLPAK